MSKIEFTTLYRAFNKNNELLYVGISGSLMTRMNSHKRTKSWFKEMSCLTTEHYDTREEALTAESKAIKEENPKYNIQGKCRNKTYHSRYSRKIRGDLDLDKLNSHDECMYLSLYEKYGNRSALKIIEASRKRGGPAPTGTGFTIRGGRLIKIADHQSTLSSSSTGTGTISFPPDFQPSSSSSSSS